jgi:hypothetical protein
MTDAETAAHDSERRRPVTEERLKGIEREATTVYLETYPGGSKTGKKILGTTPEDTLDLCAALRAAWNNVDIWQAHAISDFYRAQKAEARALELIERAKRAEADLAERRKQDDSVAAQIESLHQVIERAEAER